MTVDVMNDCTMRGPQSVLFKLRHVIKSPYNIGLSAPTQLWTAASIYIAVSELKTSGYPLYIATEHNINVPHNIADIL